MEHAIAVDAVTKKLDGRQILRGVTFEVGKGQVFGFLGPNGAGKTTTIRIMLGLFAPDSGRATIMGQDCGTDRARQYLGFVVDGDGLYDNATAEDNLAYFARIYQRPASRERIREVLGLVDLADRADSPAGTFSKGMRQRLAIARSLIHDPDVLILDEPTSGVDPSAQIEIRQLLLDIARNQGKAVLLSSHNMDEVQRICDRIALLYKGEVVLSGSLDELSAHMGRGGVVVRTDGPVPQAVWGAVAARPDFGLAGEPWREPGAPLEFTPADPALVPDIVRSLTEAGARITAVERGGMSLEEMYTSIVRRDRTA
ncbi:ABC-2 type transport system ATP-binding protein [Streptomyces zhaozhouensis]|uniref:ABC-2 type transport system ATP-binding protein n=1 Tax=Streptomyces zhaozhouensis TaxID=1300267 RepID=A0A286DYW0_9ACTN|nr:ABC transporter ATP-binding protein [Streptomyces zhaozhouensis]SOD63845.1 ABC-2 type transport system ATP-binding protein [Streptomyces zhaozhouensis]